MIWGYDEDNKRRTLTALLKLDRDNLPADRMIFCKIMTCIFLLDVVY